MRKLFLTKIMLVLMLVLSIAFAGACSEEDSSDSGNENQPTTLVVPVVSVSDTGLASWNAVENAAGYVYRLEAEDTTGTAITETQKQLLDKQSISVKAVGDGEKFLDSDWSTFASYSRIDVEKDKYNGWYNYSPDSAEFIVDGENVEIAPQGTAFGSQVILNEELAKVITGAYYMSFDLDATEYDTGAEIWISILGCWNEALGNGFRTGLHFKNNDWMDIASYGFAQGQNYGFRNVISYVSSDDGVGTATEETKKLFPSVKEIVKVVFAMDYDENENIAGKLYLNGVLVQTMDYTALYGQSFTFTDVQAVGFDFFIATRYDIVIRNVKVTDGSYTPGESEDGGETTDKMNGWVVASEGAGTLKRNGNDVVITPTGTTFGNGFILNEEIMKGIEGEYAIEFDLKVTLTNAAESWISIVGAYASTEEGGVKTNKVMRSGLHFFANTWNNIAFYGSVPTGETGFFKVIWPTDNAAAFPALTNTLHVKETYTYDEAENIIVKLYVNDVVVSSYNLTTYYGADYNINDCSAVGFDVYVGEQGAFEISGFKVSAI